MLSEIYIPGFTVTSLLLTAVICLVAVLAAWYTVRSRVKFSQIILGLFCYLLVMVLEQLFGSIPGPASGLAYGIRVVVTTVIAREVVRFLGLRFGIRGRFDSAEGALGFGLGFGGLYLLVCAAYYFNLYTTASAFTTSGADAFAASVGTDLQDARSLLELIAGQSGWEFLLTGVNRVFFLVRELSLSVLLWYGLDKDDKRFYLFLVPLMHLIAIVPEGLFQAGLLTSGYVRDILICLLSGGIAFLASREYNRGEDQVAHFRIEKLRARRRR